jgi:hypothetical protein
VKTSFSNGEDVLLSGFGKFFGRKKEARRGRNPATGEDLTLDPRRVTTFKCLPQAEVLFDSAANRVQKFLPNLSQFRHVVQRAADSMPYHLLGGSKLED